MSDTIHPPSEIKDLLSSSTPQQYNPPITTVNNGTTTSTTDSDMNNFNINTSEPVKKMDFIGLKYS